MKVINDIMLPYYLRLIKSKNIWKRSRAIKQLAKSKSVKSTNALVETLMNDNIYYYRERAADALRERNWSSLDHIKNAKYVVTLHNWEKAIQNGEYSVDPLIELYIDIKTYSKTEFLSTQIKRSLIKIGLPSVLPLFKATEENNRYIDDIIVGIGSSAVPLLIANLGKWNSLKCVRILGKIGDARAIEPLVNLINHQETELRLNASLALAKFKDNRAVDPLIDLLEVQYTGFGQYVQANTVRTLGKLGDPKAIQPILSLLWNLSTQSYSGRGFDLMNAVVVSLEELKVSEEIIIPMLKVPEKEIRYRAASLLNKLDWQPTQELEPWYLIAYNKFNFNKPYGISAIEPIFNAYKDDTLKYKLEKIKDSHAVEIFINALSSSSYYIQEASAHQLGIIGDTRAIKPLLSMSDNIRDFIVVDALSKVGTSAIEELIEALDPDNPIITKRASIALGLIGNKKAIKPLLKLTKNGNLDMRCTAWKALGYIRDINTLNIMIERIEVLQPLDEEKIESRKNKYNEAQILVIAIEQILDHSCNKLNIEELMKIANMTRSHYYYHDEGWCPDSYSTDLFKSIQIVRQELYKRGYKV